MTKIPLYRVAFTLAVIMGICLFNQPLLVAQDQTDQGQSEEESVFDKVNWLRGPSTAGLGNWAEIKLPEGYIFANGDDTRMLMQAMGNSLSNQEVGLLAPETFEWFVVYEFNEVGYIKDDEKNDLDADAMLDSIKDGTEKSNQRRREAGFPGLTIIGWEVSPHYNDQTHNLEWAIKAKDDNGELVVNHNTRLLGRHGVMKATLVVDPKIMASVLPVYDVQLSDFSFKSGEKYSEFSQGDKLAAYGLSALVVGGAGAAAAKLGLFKILGKYIKLIFVGIIAFFAAVRKKISALFQGNK